MVGPTRVGKTSTLASMSESLQNAVNKLQYHTTIPDDLLQIVTQFKNSVSQNEIVVNHLPMKDGTGKKIAYKIDLISQDQEKDISVDFIDVPGGWFIPPSQEKPNSSYEEVKDLLRSSISSLWCIDCVSMIEGKNDPQHDYHKTRNEPELITELYKNIDLPNKHRVIFVLMRAETYIHGKSLGIDWLFEQFEQRYGQYVNELKQRFSSKEIEVYVTYVETLGCFKFKSWQKNQTTKELEATYCKFANQYSPNNCETPALLVIDRSLRAAIEFYEAKKNENLECYQKRRKGIISRNISWLFRSISCGVWGDPNEAFRVEDIHQLLKDEKKIDSEEYPKEFEAHPDLNAHLVLERLKRASNTMSGLVDGKKSSLNARLL